MIDDFVNVIRGEACNEFQYVIEGQDRFRIMTPFELEDGDLISVLVKRQADGNWLVSDEGFMLTHLTYDIDERDLGSGNRKKILDATLESFSLKLEGRVLSRYSQAHEASRAVYDLIQGMLRISNLSFLSRERVRTMFVDDFRAILSEAAQGNVSYDWYDQARDPSKRYRADARIDGKNGRSPLFLFALTSETRTRDATITLLKYKDWRIDGISIGVFEDMSEISRPVLDRFIESSDKQIVNFSESNQKELVTTICEQLAA